MGCVEFENKPVRSGGPPSEEPRILDRLVTRGQNEVLRVGAVDLKGEHRGFPARP